MLCFLWWPFKWAVRTNISLYFNFIVKDLHFIFHLFVYNLNRLVYFSFFLFYTIIKILLKLVNESSLMMTISQDRYWAFSNILYFDQLGKNQWLQVLELFSSQYFKWVVWIYTYNLFHIKGIFGVTIVFYY